MLVIVSTWYCNHRHRDQPAYEFDTEVASQAVSASRGDRRIQKRGADRDYLPENCCFSTNRRAAVLDFGGGAGIHYKLARQQSPGIRWAVVETSAMVYRASELATDQLMFFDDVEKAADWLGSIDLIHSNGAIQYVDDPIGTVKALCAAARAAKMVWYRVPISDGAAKAEVQTSLLSDNGPGQMPTAKDKLVKYERHWISESAFVAAHEGYCSTEQGPDPRERGSQQFSFARIDS
ncbi:methyltransferase domain-containing protein [Bradyrhizobium cosmicum]|nr:methyltransferase domain-containing protein [Bradyrhizobium cosmicum]